MGKTVLVTGAGGFIGSHLTERLVREGYEVRALVRYNGRDDRGHLDRLSPEVRAAVEVHRGDLKDPEAVRKAVEGRAWVFHLGALIAIPYSYQNPLDVVQTNVIGTAHVLDACRASGVLERVVLTSTSEVYGTALYVPIDERHPLQGQSPYAATKIGSDALGESYHRAFGLPVTILRPFNTFGPRQSARAIIPTIISQALTRPSIRLGSLDPRRDLTYVKDTVSGFVAIAGCDAALGRVVNVGRGEDVSIGELVERIAARLGTPIHVETDSDRVRPKASEVGRLLAGTALDQQLAPGTEVRLMVERQPDPTANKVAQKYKVRISAPEQKIVAEPIVELVPGGQAPVTFRAQAAGMYQISVLSGDLSAASRGLEIREANVELDRPGRDMGTLRQWAGLTGGIAVKAEECRDATTLLETIRRRAASAESNQTASRSMPLGMNWFVLLVLIALVGTEWALRKRWDWV